MLILRTVDRAGNVHGFRNRRGDPAGLVGHSAGGKKVRRIRAAAAPRLIKGWLVGEWGRTAENRRARYYHITRAGQQHLARELESYHRVSRAIAAVLRPA